MIPGSFEYVRPTSVEEAVAALVEHDALQCGFCTPGMVMSCAHLADRKGASCTPDDVRQATSGHLCRCGAYPNIFAATLAAAGARPAGDQRAGGERATATDGDAGKAGGR